MTLRVTILLAVDICSNRLKTAKEKPQVTTQMVQTELGIKDSRISSKLYQYGKEGFLKKVKIAGGSGNAYTVVQKGRTEINGQGLKKFNSAQLAEWVAENPKGGATAAPAVSMSSQAMSAVEGISNLIEENDRLKMTLISIRSQITQVLRDDSDGTDQE